MEAAENHRVSLKNRPKTIAEYLDSLDRQGLTQTVAELRRCLTGEEMCAPIASTDLACTEFLLSLHNVL